MAGEAAEPDGDAVELSVDGRVATVVLNRPAVLNAVNMSMLARLVEVFDQINDSPEIWCVVVKGSGRSFCVGADQRERIGMSPDDVRRRRRLAPVAFSAMRRCVRPVIAQVHGYALGSGLEIALGCDLVVVAEGTTMGLIETSLAAIPAGGGTQMLPRLVGLLRAKELILTGRRFSAEDAFKWGMVSYLVEPSELEAKVLALAAELVAAAPIAVAQAKKAIDMSFDLDLATGLQVEAALYERTLTTKDRAEALEAYHEGRPPVYRGE